MAKESGFYQSLFGFKCPRCRKGSLFTGPLRIKNALEMPTHCAHCGLKFEPEPGFYYGAMFVSYIFIGFFSLAFIGICLLGFKLSVGVSFGLLILVLSIGFLWNLRFARSLYIHLLTKYEPNISESLNEHTKGNKSE
jgi:uncharacterized protein (DUF983 family)